MAALFFMHLIQAVLAARDSLRIAIQLMTALEIEIDNKLNYLLALYNHMKDMEARMKNRVESREAVALNMRGILFIIDSKFLDIFFHTLIYSDPDPIRGHYFIDRPYEGFDRIVNAMRGEELSYDGLNDYEAQCINANVNYFRLPYKRVFKVSEVATNLIGDNSILYTSCLYVLQDGRVCIGFNHGLIKIFNSSIFECEMELLGHDNTIYDIIQLTDGRICSASKDKFIKLWNRSSGVCEATLFGYGDQVTVVVQYSPTQLCSCSDDGTIRLWDISTGICLKEHVFDYSPAIALVLQPNGYVACLSYIGFLRICDVNRGVVANIYVGNRRDDKYCSYRMIQLPSGDLCIGSNIQSRSAEVSVWDYKTYQKIKTIHSVTFRSYFNEFFCLILLQDGRLAVGTCTSVEKDEDFENESTLFIYNLETFECEQELNLSRGQGFNAVQLNDGRLLWCVRNNPKLKLL
jgi:WD40 repeat protein